MINRKMKSTNKTNPYKIGPELQKAYENYLQTLKTHQPSTELYMKELIQVLTKYYSTIYKIQSANGTIEVPDPFPLDYSELINAAKKLEDKNMAGNDNPSDYDDVSEAAYELEIKSAIEAIQSQKVEQFQVICADQFKACPTC